MATGAGLLGAGTHPSATEGDAEITDKERYERIRDLLGDAVATPVARAAHPRRDARRRDRDPRLQRPAPPPAAAAGARRELAVPPRPRHRARLGARGDHARLAALGRAARDARLRGLLRDGARCSPAPPTCPTTRGSGGSCARTRGSGTVEIRALDAQASLEDTPRSSRSRTASRATPPTAEPGADPPAEVLEEGIVPRRALRRRAPSCPDADGRAAPGRRVLDEALELARPHARRARLRGRARRPRGARGAAAAAPGASAPRTRSPGWTRCCARLTETTGAGSAAPPAPRGGSLAQTAPSAGA